MPIYLGGRAVYMHDLFVALRVPEGGRPLYKIIAYGDDQVGLRKLRHSCQVGAWALQADGTEGLRGAVINAAFAHKCVGDGKVQPANEIAKSVRGPAPRSLPADNPVSHQHEGSPGLAE